MILGIRQLQLETLQQQTATHRQACSVVTFLIFRFDNLHLAGAPEIIAGSQIDSRTKIDIGTNGNMFDKALIPVVQP